MGDWQAHAGLTPELHLSPALSNVVVGLASLPFVLGCAVALWRARRHGRTARSEEQSVDPQALLIAGEVVVSGKVEYARDADLAMRIEVVQQGSESESSGTWSHRWEERERRLRLRPFYLRLANGERVRVEPAADALLVDALDGMVLVNRTERIRTAELTPGEQVFVRGTLGRDIDPEAAAGAYRGQRVLVLRPSPGHRMLVSSEPLGKRFRERQRVHRRWAFLFAALAVVMQAAFVSFYVLAFAGTTVAGTVEGARVEVSKDSEGDDTTEYQLDVVVRLPDGDMLSFAEQVSSGDFGTVHQGDSVPVRLVTGSMQWATQVSSGATVNAVPCVGLAGFGIWLWVSYTWSRRSSRPWYMRPVNDSGSGQLPDVPAKAQAGDAAEKGQALRGHV